PLSHDEVVHGKGSLLHKMSGDAWRQMANLRALLAFQWTRPGKVLLFMGSELAPAREWNHETGLDRYLEKDPAHRGVRDLVAALGQLYQSRPCLWRLDHEPAGFRWIACHDRGRSVFAYARLAAAPDPDPEAVEGGEQEASPGAAERLAAVDHLLVVLNLTPVPRPGYRLGAPAASSYRVVIDTDDKVFGGSGYRHSGERRVEVEEVAADGLERSLVLTLPPLAALVLEPAAGEP
ncbi:MAG: alpha amylase C-terminal domain-containing protein, partial [Acidobacteriota bacterium]